MENGGEIGRGNGAEIAALGKEEAEKAVGVLIAATLPGLVGFGKENGSVELSFKGMEISELRAVVQGKAENRHPLESGKDGSSCIFSSSGRDRIAADEARLSINQSNGSAFAASANDGIAFPIANTLSEFDLIRPVRNDAVRMDGVEVSVSVDFALAAAAQVELPTDAGKQAAPDVPVDGGRADRTVRMFKRPTTGNGGRRPISKQTVDDKCFQLRIGLQGRVAKVFAATMCFVMGRKWMISFFTAVPLQFAAD